MRAVSNLPSVPARGEVLMPMVIERLGSSTCSGSRAIGLLGVGEGLANGDVVEAGHGNDVAGAGALGGDAFERLGDEHLGDLGVFDRPVDAAPRHALAALEGAVDDPAERQTPEVGRGVEVAHERLQAVTLFVLGRRARSPRWSRRAGRGRPRWPSGRSRPSPGGRWRRGWGRRSGARRRRGRGRGSRPRSTTSSTRASGRSTLLMTSTTGRRFSRVLRRTKRVWGRGPRRRRPAGSRRRPWPDHARPRRRSRRVRGCR